MSVIDQSKGDSADVYRGTFLIGKIQRKSNGSVFTYDLEFLKNLNSEEIEKGAAFHLPYSRPTTETAGVNLQKLAPKSSHDGE